MPIFPEVLHTEQPVIGGLGIGQKVSGRAAVQKSRVHQETAKRTLPDLQFLRRSPDIGAVFFMDKGVIEICFRPQPFHLAGELPVFLMLGKKLVGKSQKYFRLSAACSRREAVMYPPVLRIMGRTSSNTHFQSVPHQASDYEQSGGTHHPPG